jgi:soluble lytic murein transglycosylase-like protein
MWRPLTALFVVHLFAAPASAEIYRYVLEDGTVMYTTEPQRGARATEVYGEPAREARRERHIPTPPDRPNPNPERNPDAFDAIIREASAAYDIPFEFIKAVIRVESAFDPHAVSHAGAQGLMQLMPATAEDLNCADPFDPRENIMAGTQFLRTLSNRYNGDINLVLAAYNAGSGTVSRYDGIPYEATRRYIQRVFNYYESYLEGVE